MEVSLHIFGAASQTTDRYNDDKMNFAHRTAIAWLSALLMLWGAVAPGVAASRGGHSVVVCTANGTQVVQLDESGHPVQGDNGKSHCPLCTVSHGDAALPAQVSPMLADSAHASPVCDPPAALGRPERHRPPARAPPQ